MLVDGQAFTPARSAPARVLVTLGQIELVESGRNRAATGSFGRPEARSWLVRPGIWRRRDGTLVPPDRLQ